MSAIQHLKERLEEDKVYRRQDLTKWSNAIDRHLKILQHQGVLKKLSGGLYYRPKSTVFGDSPSPEKELVRGFLKDTRFLITNFNLYNRLGVGTTQLYNETLVYNHKRHGAYILGGRTFHFKRIAAFPKVISLEFLLVDLVNNLKHLAENKPLILDRIRKKVEIMTLEQRATLADHVKHYGGASAKKVYAHLLNEHELIYGA